MEPISVKLEDIGPEGVSFCLNLEPQALDLSDSNDARFLGPINAEATIRKAGRKLRLSMSVNFTAALACSRCLAETEHRLGESADLTLIRGQPILPPELRLEEKDLTTQFFSGEEIDLAPFL
ncbi:MAG: YceD family protein, partial [Candidatus Hydrothermia bacterium]